MKGCLGLGKKNENKRDLVMLAHSVTKANNSDRNRYIVCIFLFTALIHCTICRDCSHIVSDCCLFEVEGELFEVEGELFEVE